MEAVIASVRTLCHSTVVRPPVAPALTTTWPVGAITPGVTTGIACGENVITSPCLVVTAIRAGHAASASVILAVATVVGGDSTAVSGTVVGNGTVVGST